MVALIANILGRLATIARGGGMLLKNANSVKVWVTVGNLLWAINGVLTENVPLVCCNVFCLIIFAIDWIKNKKK